MLLAICGGGPLLIRPGVSFVRLAVQFALLAALWALAVLVSQSMGNRASQLVDGA
ncbi:MAG: hypothetical protein IT359_10620 [Gemmatimonadaceae bacterium]|nr:hypothetical protein [Gemmatimonadaceae bacterium]